MNVAVSDAEEELVFYEVADSIGLSTLSAEMAEGHRKRGRQVVERRVRTTTIGRLIEEHRLAPPDLLSIDVENHEGRLLADIPFETWRPAVLVIESIVPGTKRSCHAAWEPALLKNGYLFAAFNGVNRFYVREDLAEWVERLSVPVNALDGYERYETVLLRREVAALRARLGERGQETEVRGQECLPHSLAIVWEGDVDALHSLAVVNRAIVERLRQRGHLVEVRQTATVPAARAPGERASEGQRLPRPADVVIRHRWPADFSPPAQRKLIVWQPWEFGSAPREWVKASKAEHVAEIWAPSEAVRYGFVRSGMLAEKVHVVPYGVDVSIFRPASGQAGQVGDVSHMAPTTVGKSKFKFLYVGGTIWRKGFDILLAAYGRAFTAADDVCLVVKDMGVGQFYRGQTAEAEIAAFKVRTGVPALEYLTADLAENNLADLYTACDCLALTYRGEGFGLPIVEAMACGIPVIVTDGGPAREWCDSSNSYLVPARPVRFQACRAGEMATVEPPWILEPEVEALAKILRRVYENREEAERIGRAGCATVFARLTWEHAVDVVERRLGELAGTAGAMWDKSPTCPAQIEGTRADKSEIYPTIARRPKVSLCMIVKNEAHNLPHCLAPFRGVVADILVVDTGSTDATREVAASLGARVFEFPWCDSFAAARNASIKHARGEWIFWMDADDRIDAENLEKLKKLFDSLDSTDVAYVMKCVCVASAPGETATAVDHVRLFRNDPQHRWKYRVHEQILPAIRATNGEVRWSDVVIQHIGYTDPALLERKHQRDLRLLHLEQEEHPDDPYNLFNLGQAYRDLHRPREALAFIRRSLDLSSVKDSIVRKLYSLIALCHQELKEIPQALGVCAEGRRHYPDDAELLFVESNILRAGGDDRAAEERLTRLLNGTEDHHFASVAIGLRGYKARHNLAVICRDQKRYAEAETHWLAALKEEPAFLPAHAGLGDIYAKTKNWEKLEARASAVSRLGPRGEEEGMFLLGLGKFHLGELSAARFWLKVASERFPQSLRIKRLLAQVTLEEGLDRASALPVLRDIVALDPGDEQAKRAIASLEKNGR